MSKSNTIKAEFLGMPYGTAMNRLRKQLMFRFAQELGYDECFACGERICTPEELSVEHKEPWLNRDIAKFWDLDNIAFSHLVCNRPHIKGAIKLRKVGPQGTAWCTTCKDYKPVEEFQRDASQWDGYNNKCRPHQAIHDKKRRS